MCVVNFWLFDLFFGRKKTHFYCVLTHFGCMMQVASFVKGVFLWVASLNGRMTFFAEHKPLFCSDSRKLGSVLQVWPFVPMGYSLIFNQFGHVCVKWEKQEDCCFYVKFYFCAHAIKSCCVWPSFGTKHLTKENTGNWFLDYTGVIDWQKSVDSTGRWTHLTHTHWYVLYGTHRLARRLDNEMSNTSGRLLNVLLTPLH